MKSQNNIEIPYGIYDTVNDFKKDQIRIPISEANKPKYECYFKHIIVFTNDKSDNNKTLKNIKDAIKNLPKNKQPELHVFIAAKCDYDDKLNKITIMDDDENFIIENQSNIDTLVFSRLSVMESDECSYIVKILQDRGFLVLNPIRNSLLASNKYETARLFASGDIPQPRFCVMTKSILWEPELFEKNIREIFPDYSVSKSEKYEVVIKILNGHGGIGVFKSNTIDMIPILQAIFAISPSLTLLIQKKEQALDGDIRVHVLTLRNRQVILGAMKRKQLSHDFRSNVSLGADAVTVELTDTQKELALRVAKISGLPWCAVDIMPIKKNELAPYDNVVLEMNASPGTDGITEVMGENFINILLNELNDPSEFCLQPKIAGYIETISINFGQNQKQYLAKLDTGNSVSAITLEVGKYSVSENTISFEIENKKLTFRIVDRVNIIAGKNTNGETRPVFILPELTIGHRKIQNIRATCVENRNNKSTNVLLNRDVLSKLGYIIDSAQGHILTDEMEKVKII